MYALSFVITAMGFLLPLWPLCVVGISISALSGRWIFAVFMALLIDLAWGAPFGVLQYVYFPFTALALALAAGRYFLSGYFLDRAAPDTL